MVSLFLSFSESEDTDTDCRHFDGEEAFNTGPMAAPSETPANVGVTKL